MGGVGEGGWEGWGRVDGRGGGGCVGRAGDGGWEAQPLAATYMAMACP